MRKTAVVNLNSSKLILTLKNNCSIVLFTLIFAIGVVFGTVLIKQNPTVASAAETIFKNYISERTLVSFFRILITSLLNLLPLFLAIFLCGTSLVGVVLIPILIIYKGFSFGILTGYLYMTYLLKGIAFNALILVPTNLIGALVLIYFGRISFRFSFVLLKSSMPKGQSINLYNNFQDYFKNYSLGFVFLIISALIDALMSIGFIKLFNF